MRILVTNDDGVDAPGLAALTRELVRWAGSGPVLPSPADLEAGADPRTRGQAEGAGEPPGAIEIVVVAPLSNFSGASAAVGAVYEREEIAYETAEIDGAPGIPAFGIDGSPALAVIIGALGGFGPRPDLVLSGINLGVNVGRSVLHSGTIGAVLAGAQLGISGLAVSMRSGRVPPQWGAAARAAVELVPALAGAPPRTILNLNAPSVPFADLRGIRRGRISTAGIIKAAGDGQAVVHHRLTSPSAGNQVPGGTDAGGPRAPRAPGLPAGPGRGAIRLRLGAAIPSLGDVGDEDPEDDGALVAAGFASVTPLSGVREDSSVTVDEVVRAGLDHVHEVLATLRPT